MPADIHMMLQEYDRDNKNKESSDGAGSDVKKTASMAENLVTQNLPGGDKAKVIGVRNAMAENAKNSKANLSDDDRLKEASQIASEIEYGYGRDLQPGELRKCIAASFTNCLRVVNAQKVILMTNRENARRGLSFEQSVSSALVKSAGKGQTSTITIPTQLLRHVQQEIGDVGVKATQNDAMTGFLYWYFGKPEDVYFTSEDMAKKVIAIASGLDVNASPSKFNKLNYNTSNSMLEKMDDICSKLDTMLSMIANLTKDSIEGKVKDDKIYIALCYNILNLLAFTPPVMPGEKPEDIDMLAGGDVWDLMSGIDDAYDYFKTTNGREIYKAKVRSKMNVFTSKAPVSGKENISNDSAYDVDYTAYDDDGYVPVDGDQYTGDEEYDEDEFIYDGESSIDSWADEDMSKTCRFRMDVDDDDDE